MTTLLQNPKSQASQAFIKLMTEEYELCLKGWLPVSGYEEPFPCVEEVLDFSHFIISQVAPLCGLAPAAWHRTAKALEKADPKRGRWLPALLSPKTVLPRDHADGLAGKLLESEHSALILKTDIILSDPAHLPAPPTTMFTFGNMTPSFSKRP